MDTGKATCVACGAGEFAAKTGSCAPLSGTAIEHAFSDFTTQPGDEIAGLCQSWTIGNDAEIWVNAVELTQNEMSHHSNWTFVPEDKYPGADGVWTCADRGYDELGAALAGGVLYAQSTQATHEVQKFPEGAAVRIPPHYKIISDVHVLNVGSTPVTGHIDLKLYTLDVAQVTHKLTPFHMRYHDLEIPPLSTSRFTGECSVATDFTTALAQPFDAKLYYVLPHTHKLGTRFFLQAMGGPMDGQSIFDLGAFNGEARGRAYDPPIDLSSVSGLRFGCEFQNPRTDTIHYGIGDQEMCEMLGFIESAAAFDSEIEKDAAVGTDGATALHSGPCQTLIIPWDHKQ